jgi:superfamily II DNA/RNA helicase
MQDFNHIGLAPALLKSLEAMQFLIPTPIQAQAIPPALLGRDILGSAQTGTGKTGAFGIPLVNKLLTTPRGSALIMTPTRELAVQVTEMMTKLLGRNSPIKTALLIGGDSMPKQFMQLKARPRLIVGTPGRINDHLTRGTLMLADTQFLVLDETDRMLDMGFQIQIEKIIKFMSPQRQTLLFSATLPDNIVSLSSRYMRDPVRVSVGSTTNPIARIQQELIHTSEEDKFNQLTTLLDNRTGSIIVFVKTKRGAEKMAEKLSRSKHSADTIHGDLRQSKRDRVISSFRDKRFRILVATDVAARGLDIPHIEHVINYDLPQCPEDYIHRIGRTARAGAEGCAVNLVSAADRPKWKAIHHLINPTEKLDMPRDGQSEGDRKKTGAPFRRNRRFGETSGGKTGDAAPAGKRSFHTKQPPKHGTSSGRRTGSSSAPRAAQG